MNVICIYVYDFVDIFYCKHIGRFRIFIDTVHKAVDHYLRKTNRRNKLIIGKMHYTAMFLQSIIRPKWDDHLHLIHGLGDPQNAYHQWFKIATFISNHQGIETNQCFGFARWLFVNLVKYGLIWNLRFRSA